MANDLTQAELKRLFDYDPATGVLIRRVPLGCAGVGSIAGSIKPDGYVRININKRPFYAHRLVWLWHYGSWPTQQLDHINHQRADNRVENLRGASMAQNKQNSILRANNPSGCRGVTRCRTTNKWWAQIGHENVKICLGRFDILSDAIAARQDAERRLHSHSPLHKR